MKKILSLAVASALVTACSGGGSSDSSGNVSGLTMPESMSVVTATDDGSGPQNLNGGFSRSVVSKGSNAYVNKIATDPDTDYSTDAVNTYVYDASMDSLDTVNMILCLMAQTRASDMVNAGPYLALVNENKCEQGQNQSSSASTGQSSAGGVTQYSNWVINSTRASNTAPQHVKIWIPGAGGSGRDNQNILVDVSTTAAASDSDPYGSFTLSFKGVVDAGDFSGTPGDEMAIMGGTLRTVANGLGKPQFSFINVEGDDLLGGTALGFGSTKSANVILDDASGTGGVAMTHRSETGDHGSGMQTEASTYAIAFDAGHLLRGKDTDGNNVADAENCKSRTAFNTQVWRYNLYHAVDGTFNGEAVTGGQRVVLNSGFPFKYDGNKYGFVGYNGVWTESGSLADGAEITKFDYSNNATSVHTVHVSAGKLTRRTANNALLSSFQGDEFQFWGEHPTLGFGQWVVTRNSSASVGTDAAFIITGQLSFGNNGPEITDIADVNVTLNNTQSLWLWSDALGGNVVYVQDDAVDPANRNVTFYKQEIVSPSDSLFTSNSITLNCYDRCLKGGLTQNDITAASGNESALYYTYSNTPILYTLTSSNGKLTLTDDSNNNAVVSTVGLDLSSVQHDWGISTGEMVVSALADPTQPWLIYNEPVTLRWETGNNSWNQLVTVTDANNNVATFDKPLQFTYTHLTANDANGSSSYNNKKFMLQYGGVGQLWGFPWEADVETGRWQSSVTLEDGVELTDGTNTFLVKAIEKQQTMQDDDGNCGSLNVSTVFSDLTLPGVNDIGAVSFKLADKPVVTDAPAVIEGELQ